MKKQNTYSFKRVIVVLVLIVLLMMKESTLDTPIFQIKVDVTKSIEVPIFTFYLPIGF